MGWLRSILLLHEYDTWRSIYADCAAPEDWYTIYGHINGRDTTGNTAFRGLRLLQDVGAACFGGPSNHTLTYLLGHHPL
jgi:hypothetical protein